MAEHILVSLDPTLRVLFQQIAVGAGELDSVLGNLGFA